MLDNITLYALSSSILPASILVNLFVSASLLRTIFIGFALFGFNSLPFNNDIGFALPATTKPKVTLVVPAANEQRILFLLKSSYTKILQVNKSIISGKVLIFLFTEPLTSLSVCPFLQKSKSVSSKVPS